MPNPLDDLDSLQIESDSESGKELETRAQAQISRKVLLKGLEVRLSAKLLIATLVATAMGAASGVTAWLTVKGRVTASEVRESNIEGQLKQMQDSEVRMWEQIQHKRDKSDY